MSKFLYPIYKLKTKSYIKWWLYHKKAGESGVLSEILEGFSFNLANTLNRKFNLFEIEGNSVQDGTPSPDNEVPILSSGDNENLLPYPYTAETKTMNGVTFIVNKDGTIIANGTATANAYFMLKGDIDLNGTYTIGTGLGISLSTYMALLDQNDGYADKMTTRINNATATVNSRFQAYIYVTQGTTVDNLVFKPKLEKGNKATPYSPYGMGSINEKIQTRNLWSSVWEQGYINANGVNENNSDLIRTKDYIYFEPEQHYAIKRSIFNSYTNVRGYDINKKFIGAGENVINLYQGNTANNPMQPTIQTCVIATKPGVYYLRFNDASNNLSTEYMMVKGDTPEDYAPHEEQDYSIYTQQPFRSIGDVRDCFVKKSDVWYERHYITQLGLDGTGNWSRSDTNGFMRYVITLANMKSVGSARSTDILCNIFNPSTENGYNNCFAFNNTVAFYVPANIEDFKGFKELLQEKNAKLQYELAEPLDLPCTPEQIQQLENKPSTYKDFTIIQSEDETPAHLKIQYYKEG